MIDHWIKRNIPSFEKYFSALHFFNSVRGQALAGLCLAAWNFLFLVKALELANTK